LKAHFFQEIKYPINRVLHQKVTRKKSPSIENTIQIHPSPKIIIVKEFCDIQDFTNIVLSWLTLIKKCFELNGFTLLAISIETDFSALR